MGMMQYVTWMGRASLRLFCKAYQCVAIIHHLCCRMEFGRRRRRLRVEWAKVKMPILHHDIVLSRHFCLCTIRRYQDISMTQPNACCRVRA